MNAITPQMWAAVWKGLWETLQMTGITSFFTVLIGLPLGVLLFALPNLGRKWRPLSSVLNAVVNVTRSFPFAILMLSLIPITRMIVGSSVGPVAATVPLTVSAVPFFARLVETALRDLPTGKTDAAIAMGSSRSQIVRKVWLPEAMPNLVSSITTTIVTIIGYSAMAGLVGGGGLGRLAYNYGYQRFIPEVMIVTIVILIVIVQVVQLVGDLIARSVDHR